MAIALIVFVLAVIALLIVMPILNNAVIPIFQFAWWLILVMFAVEFVSTTAATVLPILLYGKKSIVSIIRDN